MKKFVSKIRKSVSKIGWCFVAVGLLLISGCGGGKSSDSGLDADSSKEEAYHADDDIAMTVRSVVDAIRVGEPLDTVEYNYDCIFTDGQGSPIYTNLHGLPGKWNVDAVSPDYLTIRNVDLGDIMAEDLESYIVANLGLDSNNIVESLSGHADGAHTVNVYDFGGGQLKFEIHPTTTPTGIEAPIVIISLSRD